VAAAVGEEGKEWGRRRPGRSAGGRGGRRVDPASRRTAGGSGDRGERRVDPAPRRTTCGFGGRDGCAPFPCAARRPQLAAPARSLDLWRRALSLERERERERANKRERERCGHATLIEKKKCGASAPGANEKANPRSVQMGWDG
jgi:hypothetical protein